MGEGRHGKDERRARDPQYRHCRHLRHALRASHWLRSDPSTGDARSSGAFPRLLCLPSRGPRSSLMTLVSHRSAFLARRDRFAIDSVVRTLARALFGQATENHVRLTRIEPIADLHARRADDDVVDAIAVEITRAAHRPARLVVVVDAFDDDARRSITAGARTQRAQREHRWEPCRASKHQITLADERVIAPLVRG